MEGMYKKGVQEILFSFAHVSCFFLHSFQPNALLFLLTCRLVVLVAPVCGITNHFFHWHLNFNMIGICT